LTVLAVQVAGLAVTFEVCASPPQAIRATDSTAPNAVPSRREVWGIRLTSFR
jgi:hypothetical protein